MKKVIYILSFVALSGLAVSCGSNETATTEKACCHAKKECAASDSCKAACEAAGKECKKDSACAAKCDAHASCKDKDSTSAE